MADSDPSATWQGELQRFREAEHALRDWQLRNPLEDVAEDDLPGWERASDELGGPYEDAAEALEALPAPDLRGILQKTALLRRFLSGHDNERELERRLQLIEADLRRLSCESD